MSSSSEKAARPIYVWPKGASLDELGAAVLELKLPFKVVPFWYQEGKHDKVIALQPGFDLVSVDHVAPKNHETRKMSVQWALGLIELPHVHTIHRKLEKIFGEGVVEVDPEASPWEPNKPIATEKGYVWP